MKILNFGSLNLDVTYVVDHFVRPGETEASISRMTACGGKGLNQSIALAKSGCMVYHAGAVGKADGAPLLQALIPIMFWNWKIHPAAVRLFRSMPKEKTALF